MKRLVALGTFLILIAACGTDAQDQPSTSEAPSRSLEASSKASDSSSSEQPTHADEALIAALTRFAGRPGPKRSADVPFAGEGVWLGLADRLIVDRSPEELVEANAWILRQKAFHGYVGPFSALEHLADAGQLRSAHSIQVWAGIVRGAPPRAPTA